MKLCCIKDKSFLLQQSQAAVIVFLLTVMFSLSACLQQESISVYHYYDYDHDFPLQDSLRLLDDNDQYRLYYLTYTSFHDAEVTGLLTIPKTIRIPLPVVKFHHGIKDDKNADYMQNGHHFLVDSGYAVLRIDAANHGDRKKREHKYNFTEGYRFWTRDLLAQTVFDLRRAVDYLETRAEIDQKRIGFLGISLGGMIGTVFCGVDQRVKVPVIALAGGGLQFVFKFAAFSDETKNYISIILFLINAQHDEVVPPMTSKLLFEKADEPKKIIWYPTRHREVPQDQVFPEAIRWFKKYL
jgi:dienelactone hydrolase